MLGPIRVGRSNRIDSDPPREALYALLVPQIQHEQRLRMRHRGSVPASRGQLEMRAGARYLQEHAVIAVVVAKPADLGQAKPVAVEPDDRVQPVGVASDA